MEDGDTVLVAGGQYGTGNRYMDCFLGYGMRVLRRSRNSHELCSANVSSIGD